MSAMPYEYDDRADRERIARESMDRWLSLVEPVLGPGRFNGYGEWGAGEYRFRCPRHGKHDVASDGLRLSVARYQWWEPRWWCPKCENGGVGYRVLLASLADAGVPNAALPSVAHPFANPSRVRPPTATTHTTTRPPRPVPTPPSEDDVARWATALRGDARGWRYLTKDRMWAPDCIELLQIGLDWRAYRPRPSFTIPVRDGSGALVNVKLWDPLAPKESNQRWGWLVGGVDNPRLWPLPQLLSAPKNQRVYLCAGEPDAMLVMSRGAVAVTSTRGEGPGGALRPEDLHWFDGQRVVVVYDSDATGRAGARAAVQALRDYGGCRTVHSRDLWPERDDGADLTDWIRAGNGLPMPRRHS